nr:hypothetical protein F13B9.7 - Caenorhabditis elegans [Caenorhabditis elegans]
MSLPRESSIGSFIKLINRFLTRRRLTVDLLTADILAAADLL